MQNLYNTLIKELKKGMNNLSNPTGNGLFNNLNKELPDLTNNTELTDLADMFALLQSQFDYTTSTSKLLNTVPSDSASAAKLEDLNTATNLVQLYFQGTQSLKQILYNLVEKLEGVDFDRSTPFELGKVRKDINDILIGRKELQKSLSKALQQFGGALNELTLEQLLQNSIDILNQPKDPRATSGLDLIKHLEKAEKLFKSFRQKSEELTGNEPNEIKQLIRNWGESVDSIQSNLSDANTSRAALAQTIQVHDLLEVNYDYLTALVRSGDLESAGIL